MRTIVVGLGTQGKKRLKVAGKEAVATVDPINPDARYKTIQQVPPAFYDSALLCVPDQAKMELLHFLLSSGKHALVEKPLLTSETEKFNELQRLADAHGVVCYTAYNHRFEPLLLRLKELIDQDRLGNIYLARFFYGNGTARDVLQSAWRDEGMGVLSDLGSHLLDMVLFLFGRNDLEFKGLMLNAFETRAYDHALLVSGGKPAIELEMTLLSWRNTFSVDIFGERGSLHLEGLCKWGPATLRIRKRVLPSGKPEECVEKVEMADPTWASEYDHFKKLCAAHRSGMERDIWINSTLNRLMQEAAPARP